MIYKILTDDEWARARADGRFAGTAMDRQDGYVHLSAADQVVETARRFFAGVTGLTVLAVDESRLGDALRWEESRGGALFPHLSARCRWTRSSPRTRCRPTGPPPTRWPNYSGERSLCCVEPARRRDAPWHVMQ
ncbi:DUF952 domain-containing protein [Micromonospora sp. BRA006-A]|nr:DUF952 domain-containing protein [Micromonospora sp. BRA006-A]